MSCVYTEQPHCTLSDSLFSAVKKNRNSTTPSRLFLQTFLQKKGTKQLGQPGSVSQYKYEKYCTDYYSDMT